eukprot:UN32812
MKIRDRTASEAKRLIQLTSDGTGMPMATPIYVQKDSVISKTDPSMRKNNIAYLKR